MAQTPDEFSPSLLWLCFKRHILLSFFLFIASVGAAFGISSLIEPRYKAQATILVQQNQSKILWEVVQAEDIKAQEILSLSQPVMQRMLALAQEKLPDVTFDSKSLKAVAVGQLLSLQVMHQDPESAAVLANAWMDANIEELQRRERAMTNYTRDFLGAQIVPDLREKWLAKRNELQRFIDEKNVDEKEFEQHPIRRTLSLVSEQLYAARLRFNKLQRERKHWLECQDDLDKLQLMPRVREHPSTKQLDARLRDTTAQLAEMERRFDANSPLLERKRADLEKLESMRHELPKSILVELQFDLSSAEADLRDLEAQFDEQKEQYETLKKNVFQRKMLELETEEARQQYEVVRKRQNEAELSGRVTFSNCQAWEYAIVPQDPVVPNWPKNIAIGGVVGLLLAGLGSYGLELLDKSIRGPAATEAALGVPMLGAVPKLGRNWQRAAYTLAIDYPVAPPVEALRIIKNTLVASSATEGSTTSGGVSATREKHGGKIVLITSPGVGDGKTFFAANLAYLLASPEAPVALIDLDRKKKKLAQHFQVADAPGLLERLSGQRALVDLAISLPNTSTHLITSGAGLEPLALERQAFVDVLDELRSRYEWVIVDAGPLLGVSSTSALAHLADLVLLVVRGRYTQQTAAMLALQTLQKVQVKGCATVLNALDKDDAAR